MLNTEWSPRTQIHDPQHLEVKRLLAAMVTNADYCKQVLVENTILPEKPTNIFTEIPPPHTSDAPIQLSVSELSDVSEAVKQARLAYEEAAKNHNPEQALNIGFARLGSILEAVYAPRPHQ
ncbi:MAG: hypothetical protein NT149_04180 [Candidatus Gottesmanbacteria bacterium]|nr:hypothetical protein [Candidatus Gottesmanbacteria bacterium]